MANAKSELVEALGKLNDAILGKLDGVGDYDLRRSLTPTGSNLLGIVKHLATVQAEYFGGCFGRPFPEEMPWSSEDAGINADMFAAAGETSDWVRDLYRRSWLHALGTIAVTDLDDTATVPWWPDDRRHPSLRTVLTHMTVETARHAGHLDILRETIDGEAGRFVGDASLPDAADFDWDAYRHEVDDAARAAAGPVAETPPEFEGDLAGAVFWGADLTGATFRDVDLTNASISHARLVDVDIDSSIERVVVNGVDVTEYVNEGDPWFPLRSMLEPSDPAGMQTAWSAIEETWSDTLAAARSRADADLHRSVDGEWAFVDTLRHMVFAIDKWFTAPIVGGAFEPMGRPNSGSVDFPWPGLDQAVLPTSTEALDAYRGRMDAVREYLGSVTPEELDRHVEVLENGDHTVRGCLWVVFEESFWHNRYARRDLARLSASG